MISRVPVYILQHNGFHRLSSFKNMRAHTLLTTTTISFLDSATSAPAWPGRAHTEKEKNNDIEFFLDSCFFLAYLQKVSPRRLPAWPRRWRISPRGPRATSPRPRSRSSATARTPAPGSALLESSAGLGSGPCDLVWKKRIIEIFQ